MGPINAAFNMKGYFAAENSWKKIVSAHKLNILRRADRERNGVGVGKDSRLCGWTGEVGLSFQRGGDVWVGREQLGDFGGALQPFPGRH